MPGQEPGKHGQMKDKKGEKTMSEMEKMNVENLEEVTGGNDYGYGYGNNWVYGTVHGVVDYGPGTGSCLTLRDCPNGNVMYTNAGKPMGWQNGESILVCPGSRQGNWIQAKYGNTIGWSNANYIWY